VIPYGRQDVTQADIDAVAAVLRSDLITQGPVVPRFEQAVAARVGAEHAVAVNSGTSALHIACAAMGLGAGGLLWTVPNTFVASANCARYCGADVDFVDIDPVTWNLSTAALKSKLAQAQAAGRLPDIVVPVHFGGQPTDQEEIHVLAREYGFRVLEDASHAIGASRHGEPVGSCRWSDVTVFSFHPVKIVTTAEGGMAMTKDPELAERMQMLRSHGITRDPARLQTGVGASPAWYYEQQLLGYNYRLTEIQAALGMSQLTRIEAYVERRNELARRYDESLAGLPLELPRITAGSKSAFHLYVVRVVEGGARNRLRVFEELRRRDIGVNVHYVPVHLQPYYRALGFREGLCPVAEAYGESAITLPLYPGLTFEQQNTIVSALRSVL
jgi:UDP-4-amino-4,6-dideoxy-N-acetyl-beta-L-altrosamine transaminase